MFINNIQNNDKYFYLCNAFVSKYLEKKGFPVLSRKDNVFVFSRTKKLQEVVDNMPFYLKLFEKVGDING
nr:MAG TPA: hypothetical protein [Caudoviricetes sp.]